MEPPAEPNALVVLALADGVEPFDAVRNVDEVALCPGDCGLQAPPPGEDCELCLTYAQAEDASDGEEEMGEMLGFVPRDQVDMSQGWNEAWLLSHTQGNEGEYRCTGCLVKWRIGKVCEFCGPVPANAVDPIVDNAAIVPVVGLVNNAVAVAAVIEQAEEARAFFANAAPEPEDANRNGNRRSIERSNETDEPVAQLANLAVAVSSEEEDESEIAGRASKRARTTSTSVRRMTTRSMTARRSRRSSKNNRRKAN